VASLSVLATLRPGPPGLPGLPTQVDPWPPADLPTQVDPASPPRLIRGRRGLLIRNPSATKKLESLRFWGRLSV
jgi:hypothetical protein